MFSLPKVKNKIKHLVLEGNIGTGKSSALAESQKEHPEFTYMCEPLHEFCNFPNVDGTTFNPLEVFYKHPNNAIESYKHPCLTHAGYIGTDRSLLTGHNGLLLRQIARDLLYALLQRHNNTWTAFFEPVVGTGGSESIAQ